MKSLNKLAVITFLILSFSTFAQWRAGITIAPQITGTLNLDATQREGIIHIPTPAWGVGIPVSYDVRKGKGIQTGVYYSVVNQNFIAKYKLSDQPFTHRGKKRFDFIKVPVMYRKSGRIARFVRTSFAIGLQYSYTIKFDGGMTYYEPNKYFDLPPTEGKSYFKKHAVDAAVHWGTEMAIKKRLDFVMGLKIDVALNNMAKKGSTFGDNNLPLFGKGLGWHPYSVGFQVGFVYVLSRPDHMLLPGNTYRFRPYKRKPKDMR